jgi:anhydro-N-acetylmuramic acid kinase
MSTNTVTRVVGLMSGTSHDAIDAAVVDLHAEGDTLVVHPLGMISEPYEPALRTALTHALPPAATSLAAVARLDTLIGQAFAAAAARAIAELGDGHADLVVSHGQTVYHWVQDGVAMGSLQLGQPAWIAERTGCTVVADLRARDIAAGGQGAPLVSMIDALWLEGRSAASVNLGGIANATLVRPGADPIAFDTGPANALIDAAVSEITGGAERFDTDGARAARGRVDDSVLGRLLAEPYYGLPAPKSTGKELFHAEYIARILDGATLAPDDLVATLTALTARTVADAVVGVDEVILAGGGTRNPTLVSMIRGALPATVVSLSDEHGLSSAAKEAIAFAVLGLLTVNGMSATLPSCTGARHASVLGVIVPGDAPPARILTAPPRRLRMSTEAAARPHLPKERPPHER